MLQLPAGVEAAPLGSFDSVKTDAGIRVGLGDLVSGQELAVVIKLTLPAGQVGDTIAVQVGLSDRDGVLAVPAQAIGWSVAADAACDAQRREPIVDREGVPPATLAESYEAERSIERVAHWFEISAASVRDAVEFEQAAA
jgi:hypothetical protein